MTDRLSQPKSSDLRSQFADAFSQLLQLQFFQFAQVALQFLVKSVTQPFLVLKTEKQDTKKPPKMTFLLKKLVI